MEFRKIKIIIFVAIIVIAIFFRFYELNSVPPHPSLDEVSIGYNAYSILMTGRDEFGNQFPILLRAYDDWRPAFYIYLAIPFIALFDLSVLAVRIPSAVLSILTVIAIYFLFKLFFESIKHESSYSHWSESVSILGMLLIAISPWHVYISRLGHEVNAFFSFFVFGIVFFLLYVNRISKKLQTLLTKSYFFMSVILFAFSFMSYQSGKLFVPLMGILLFLLFYKVLLQNKMTLLFALFVGCLIVAPFIFESLKPNALIRFQATNIATEAKIFLDQAAIRNSDNIQSQEYLGAVFDNRRLIYPSLVTKAYLSHLSPQWLFTNKGVEEFKIPDFGLLYLFEFPLIFFGAFLLIRHQIISKKILLLLLGWLVVSILPGAITTGYPHAMRILQIIPVFYLLGAVGLTGLLFRFYGKRNIFFPLICVVVFLFYVLWFAHSYFVNFRKELSYQFQYGVLQALSYAEEHENDYDSIFVSNQKNLSQSYMFYLFSTKFDPLLYQQIGGTKSGWFEQKHIIGKYEFINLGIENRKKARTLYITNVNDLNPGEYKIIKKIPFLNNSDAITLYESNISEM